MSITVHATKIRITGTLWPLLLLILGCAPTGRVTSYSPNPAGGWTVTEFSEYLTNDLIVADGTLRSHAILTLGNERIPENHVFTEEERSRLRDRDYVPAVFEMYLTNLSDTPITIKTLRLEGARWFFASQQFLKNTSTLVLGNTVLILENTVIEPRQWVLTQPIVFVHGVFAPEHLPYTVVAKLEDGTRIDIDSFLTRKTLEELNALSEH